jgi:hypothetical protein
MQFYFDICFIYAAILSRALPAALYLTRSSLLNLPHPAISQTTVEDRQRERTS